MQTRREHTEAMILLYFLADAFINTFGITRPSEKTRRQAALFILGLLVLLLIGMAIAAWALRSVFA